MDGHALVDGGFDGPATFTGVGHPPCEGRQRGIPDQGRSRQIKQPGSDDTAAAPDLSDLRQFEIVLKVLRIPQRCRFGVDDARLLPGIGRLEDCKPLRIGRHHPVFDAVVHHFDEVAGTTRSAMQIALLGRSGCLAARLVASGRARNVAATRSEGGEDRVEVPHRVSLAADHHAIAALETPDTATGADVDIVDAPGRSSLARRMSST